MAVLAKNARGRFSIATIINARRIVDTIIVARVAVANQNYVLNDFLGECNQSWALGLDDLPCTNNGIMGPDDASASTDRAAHKPMPRQTVSSRSPVSRIAALTYALSDMIFRR